MKNVLKIFLGKKARSWAWSSTASPRTSSSSPTTPSSPHSSRSMAESQRESPEYSKSPSHSPGQGSSKKTREFRAHHARLDAQKASPSALDRERQELADTFKVIDTNGDGKISVAELGAVLRSLGDNPSEEEVHLMVEAVDADGDGQIDLEEFINLNKNALARAGTETRSEELRAAFYVFDIDKNNFISAEELHQVMSGLGQQSLTLDDCCRMIRGVDSDGDGYVDFEEFERMMTSNCVY